MKTLFGSNVFGAGRRSMGATVEETFSLIASIKDPLVAARRADAADFKLYSEASKARILAVDALGRAEATLSAQQAIWESTHKNQEAFTAAQMAVDSANADLAAAVDSMATYRRLVDQHAALIAELWRRAEEAIASLPADRRAEGREMLAVCAVSMNGRCMHGDNELGCKKCQKGKKRKIYDPFKTQTLGQVSLAGSRPRVGQFDIKPVVNVNPNVSLTAPVNIDLGGLPLSLGLFAGAGLAFYVKGHLPKGFLQWGALGAGTLLAGAGIMNLMTAKARANEAAAQKPAPPPPPPPLVQPTSAQGKPAASEYQPSAESLLGQVSGLIVSPKDYDTVDIGPLTGSYPVRIELQNPSSSPISFVLELVAQEEGVYGSPEQASHSSQVTVNPGIMSVDVPMPIVSGHALDTIAVTLSAYKRRTAADPAEMLSMKTFLVK